MPARAGAPHRAIIRAMAITSPGTGPAPKVVVAGIMYTIGSTGSPIAVQATNNRKKGTRLAKPGKSGQAQGGYPQGQALGPGFISLDNQILALDARYDTLTNQATWDELAAATAGTWALCANCHPESSGKKLYRQINFNRALMGKARTDTPPAQPPSQVTNASFLGYTHEAGVGNDNAFYNITDNTQDIWCSINCGQQQANPLARLAGATVNTNFPPGTAIYNFITACIGFLGTLDNPSTGDIFPQACCWNDDGFPALQLPCELAWTINF